MQYVRIGRSSVSRLCVGGNPFSGYSHQGADEDRAMREYFTDQRIVEFLTNTELTGINTVFARADDHIIGALGKYYRQGGKLQWFAQICSDVSVSDKNNDSWKEWMQKAVDVGAEALYIHGGLADYWYANKILHRFEEALTIMRRFDKTAGIAGHRCDVHEWLRDNLEPDFQMCSYYNPTDRSDSPQHRNTGERWRDNDRAAMVSVVQTLKVPAIHYKILAGGNRSASSSFEALGKAMRAGDVACIGVYPKNAPGMLEEDVELLEKHTSGPAS